MINILKFIVLYLYKTIIGNPGKLIFTTLSIIFWIFAGTLPDKKVMISVSDSLHIDHNYQYVYTEISNNKVSYKIYNSTTPEKLINGKIETYEANGLNDLLWAGLILILIITIVLHIISFTDSDETDLLKIF